MNMISKDDAFEISDSTDWVETPLSSLATVDSALRCQICKDFYTTPMLTSCSHTFCSLCIRRCLNNDGRCPACRAEDQAMKLRNNLLVGELVDAFKEARPKVLEYARASTASGDSRSPKRKYTDALEGPDSSPPRKRTRSSGRTQSSEQRQPIVIDSENDDEDFIPDDGLVPCPICQGRMTIAQVSTHIDNCTGAPPRSNRNTNSSRSTLQNSLPPKSPIRHFERLPQVNYSMLKDQNLRKKLTEQGLSAAGSRQLLERRYTEWVTLWNANCDAPKPKAQGELRRELDIWERTQGGRAPSNSGQSSGAQIRDRDFDGAAWVTKHNDSFQKLIVQARQKKGAHSPAAELPKQSDTSEEQPQHGERYSGSVSSSSGNITLPKHDGSFTAGQTHGEPQGSGMAALAEVHGQASQGMEPPETKGHFIEEQSKLEPTGMTSWEGQLENVL